MTADASIFVLYYEKYQESQYISRACFRAIIRLLSLPK